MKKIIMFDLGDTLEHTTSENEHVLMPGAFELLSAIQNLRDNNGESPVLTLVSDFNQPPVEYHNLLKKLGIDNFFEPFSTKVTLSIQVGVLKPDPKIFRAAIDKIDVTIPFTNVIFVTENNDHILATRKLGMTAIQLKIPGETTGDVDNLAEIFPHIDSFLQM
jgi:FMN phosphatase YigB (HAD superfamily)